MPSEPGSDYSRFKGWWLLIGLCNVVFAMAFVVSGIFKHDGIRSGLGVFYALIGIVWLLQWRRGAPFIAKGPPMKLTGNTCSVCGYGLPVIRRPKGFRQAMWGGSTCPQCGTELDRFGNPAS